MVRTCPPVWPAASSKVTSWPRSINSKADQAADAARHHDPLWAGLLSSALAMSGKADAGRSRHIQKITPAERGCWR